MQLVDCAVLEVKTLQYKMRPLLASFLYILIGVEYRQFTPQMVVEQFPSCSVYLLAQDYAFNDLYSKFLEIFFGMTLEELLPSIQYAANFFGLAPNFDLPRAVIDNKDLNPKVRVVQQGGLFRRLLSLPKLPPRRSQLHPSSQKVTP